MSVWCVPTVMNQSTVMSEVYALTQASHGDWQQSAVMPPTRQLFQIKVTLYSLFIEPTLPQFPCLIWGLLYLQWGSAVRDLQALNLHSRIIVNEPGNKATGARMQSHLLGISLMRLCKQASHSLPQILPWNPIYAHTHSCLYKQKVHVTRHPTCGPIIPKLVWG